MTRWLPMLCFALLACTGGAGAPADGGGACPVRAPVNGAACSTTQICGYIDCAGAGVTRASCVAGTFQVTTTACAPIDCEGMTCPVGQYCHIGSGGALIPECLAAPSGPLSCESVCGAPCAGSPPANPPERIVCNTCSSGICP